MIDLERVGIDLSPIWNPKIGFADIELIQSILRGWDQSISRASFMVDIENYSLMLDFNDLEDFFERAKGDKLTNQFLEFQSPLKVIEEENSLGLFDRWITVGSPFTKRSMSRSFREAKRTNSTLLLGTHIHSNQTKPGESLFKTLEFCFYQLLRKNRLIIFDPDSLQSENLNSLLAVKVMDSESIMIKTQNDEVVIKQDSHPLGVEVIQSLDPHRGIRKLQAS
jgi:hypothetical protein